MTQEAYELVCICVARKGDDDNLLTREDGSRVVDPRDDWYTLCVTAGLGRFEPAKRKNSESMSAMSESICTTLGARQFGTS